MTNAAKSKAKQPLLLCLDKIKKKYKSLSVTHPLSLSFSLTGTPSLPLLLLYFLVLPLRFKRQLFVLFFFSSSSLKAMLKEGDEKKK